MTKANIGIPNHLWATILSKASCFVCLLWLIFLTSLLETVSLTNSYLFLSEASTWSLSVMSTPDASNGGVCSLPLTSTAAAISSFSPLFADFADDVSITLHPSIFERFPTSSSIPFFLTRSCLLRATTRGISSSKS